jgi:two-component system, NtrC family, response regulator AtoC
MDLLNGGNHVPNSEHRASSSIRGCSPAIAEIRQNSSGKSSPATENLSIMGMSAVVRSDSLQQLMVSVKKVARTQHAVLITGESGCGKELIARAIHQYSPRAGKPWIDINCAALPGHLLESELFGYEKGAFSGAESAKQGMFELANGGTLFLDEIGELELGLQAKLLRILDGASFFRLGGTRKITVDVRVVAATNSNLQEAVRAGRFREDLYHRLNQVHLRVPPLRERPEAIESLATYFLAQQDPQLRFSPETMEALRWYSWPGNVRELRNAVTMAAIFVEGVEIQPFDLPAEVYNAGVRNSPACMLRLDSAEQDLVLKALDQTGGRQDRAAELLGISRRTLIRKLKIYAQKGVRTHSSRTAAVAGMGR